MHALVVWYVQMAKGGSPADISSLRQRLQSIHREVGELLPTLVGREPLFRGYVYNNPRRCGDPSCRCAKGELHDALVVRTPKGAGQIGRILKAEERKRVEPLATSYRTFRDARRQLKALLREVLEVVAKIEDARCVDALAGEERR